MQAVINNRLVASLKPDAKPFEVRDLKLKGFILRVQPTGAMTYICQYGRGKRVTIGKVSVLTPTQARDRAREILADVVKGVDPHSAKKAAKTYNLESYLTNVYAPWAETHQKQGASNVAMIRACFSDLSKTKLDEITPWTIEKWRSAQLKKGIRPASVNRYVGSLKAALSKAVDWGFIKTNPLASVKPTKVDNTARIRYLEESEEQALRETLDVREHRIRSQRLSANTWRRERGYSELQDLSTVPYVDHLKPLVLISLNTGIRRGELLSLKWQDVNLSRAMLTVEAHTAKSGKARHIPLNNEALTVLRQWREQCNKSKEYVFPGRSGQRLSNIKRSWQKVLEDAGITDFRWHDMRHHFASRLVIAGVDLNTVRELLGHSDIKMTLRYAHLAPEVKAEAVARLVGRR